MKHYLSILMLFVAATLFGQRDGSLQTECAANAGGDKKISFDDNMTLSALIDQSYNNPPNIQSTYISGP